MLSESTPDNAAITPSQFFNASLSLQFMELYYLEEDFKVFGFRAYLYPEGVGLAYRRLMKHLPSIDGRDFFGIIQPSPHCYMATVKEIYAGEGTRYGCDFYTIYRGLYLTEIIRDWQNDPSMVNFTFHQLLSNAGVNADDGLWIEWYKSEREMMCMIKLGTRDQASETRNEISMTRKKQIIQIK
jgi:hypothetical protein